ncbi:MAG: hypothetical protein A2017_22030 [Lentisphaerae bacterium GWF2_44_16]|nr:MAG: hypothetical protein A2017_22030 [Lentisphaerae bacterium GWF2_44_16]
MKEKLKELTKDTAVYGISTILGRFLNFILVPFYTNVFATAEYGVITTVYAYIAFFNIIYIYGMDAAYMKYAFMKDERNPRTVFSTSFLFISLTSFIFSTLIVIFGRNISSALDIPAEDFPIMTYVSLILLFDALAIIPFNYLRLKRNARKFALIKTLNIMVNVFLNLILILKFKMGIEAVFISNLVASMLTLVALLPEFAGNLSSKINLSYLGELLKFGIPYLPAGMASMVVQVIDRPILQRMTDESAVGIYQANYKLGIFMMLYVSMFQYAWQPFFLSSSKDKNAKELFSKVLTYFLIVGSIILVVISLFVEDIVKIPLLHNRTLIAAAYWGGVNIIPVVLLAYLFNGMYVNFTAGIFIEGKTKYLPYITGLGALANIVVNILLIPYMGIMGAAIATLASYIAMAFALYFVSRRFYRVDYEYWKIFRIFIALGLVMAAYYLGFAGNIISKTVLLILFFILLCLLKIISLDDISSIYNMLIVRRKKY